MTTTTATKPKKKLGRPRKYAKKKEKFTVFNKKKPVIRVNPEEKEIVKWLRKNPDVYQNIVDMKNGKIKSTIKVVTTKPKINTKVVTTKIIDDIKPTTHYKNKDIKPNEADQEFLDFLKQIYPESAKREQILKNTNLSINQVKHRLEPRGKFVKFGLIEKGGGNKHDGFLYRLNLEKYNQLFNDS